MSAPEMSVPASRYASWSPTAARLLLLALCAVIVYGLVEAPAAIDSVSADPDAEGDLALYEAVVDRVAAGEPYYEVAGDELRSRGYATRPFPNWRLPTTAWVVSTLGDGTARAVLRVLAVGAVVAWGLALRASGLGRGYVVGAGLAVLSATAIATASSLVVLHEVWAALLIALSLALRRWSWVPSVAVAALALAFRELALAYVVVMLVCALVERQRREAAAWAATVGVFLVALGAHALVVSDLLTAADRSNGWVALGGWPFVLSTAQWNLVVLLVGTAVTAIAVPLALVGVASWDDALGTRLAATVGAYVATFLLLGRADNHYWGILVAPLLAVGVVFAPSGLRALARAARGDRVAPEVAAGAPPP